MKASILIVMTLLFFLQKINGGAPVTMALLLFLLLLSFTQRIVLPLYLGLVVLVYLPFLILGLSNGHPDPQIDLKFQGFYFLFGLALIQFREFNWIQLLYFINVLTFVFYGMLFFNLLPNFWSEGTFGMGGRMYGPPVISIILLLFYYILKEKQIDGTVVSAFLIGLASILLTTNFMNLIIVVGLFMLLALDFKSMAKTLGTIVVAVFAIGIFKDFLPGILASKFSYLFRPWEYPSFQMRIIDLFQVLGNTQFDFQSILFGEGFGATSRVYRINTVVPAFSGYYTFHEIDNGFYYLFHRGGLALLVLFFMSHYYLLTLIPGTKGRLALILIVLVTNLLTIHYYTHWFYLVIPFLIISEFGYKRKFLTLEVGL